MPELGSVYITEKNFEMNQNEQESYIPRKVP